MDTETRGWIAPLTGLIFVLLIVVAVTLVGADAPDPKEDSAREIVAYYQDNEGAQFLYIALLMIASPLLVIFGATLRSALRAGQPDPSGDVLPAVALAGSIIFATGIALDATITIALTDTADDVSPQAIQTLSVLFNNDFLVFASGMMIMMLGTGLSAFRHGALPKWVAVVALLSALVTPTPVGFAGFLVGMVLIAVISVLLALRARRGTVRPAVAA